MLAVALLLAACISDSPTSPETQPGANFKPKGTTPAAPLTLGTLGGDRSAATGITSTGRIVGYSTYAGGGNAFHSFLWQNGQMTDIGAPPGSSENTGITALAISDAGHIVGYASASDGVPGGSSIGAFIWKDGSFTALGQNCVESYAAAVNTKGQVAGVCSSIPVIWQNGTPTNLGSLGGRGEGEAFGINESGKIVGWSRTSPEERHAFLWTNGAMTDLGTLGGTISEANGINASGQVVGF